MEWNRLIESPILAGSWTPVAGSRRLDWRVTGDGRRATVDGGTIVRMRPGTAIVVAALLLLIVGAFVIWLFWVRGLPG